MFLCPIYFILSILTDVDVMNEQSKFLVSTPNFIEIISDIIIQ